MKRILSHLWKRIKGLGAGVGLSIILLVASPFVFLAGLYSFITGGPFSFEDSDDKETDEEIVSSKLLMLIGALKRERTLTSWQQYAEKIESKDVHPESFEGYLSVIFERRGLTFQTPPQEWPEELIDLVEKMAKAYSTEESYNWDEAFLSDPLGEVTDNNMKESGAFKSKSGGSSIALLQNPIAISVLIAGGLILAIVVKNL